jgi:hypothetical protein
MKKNYWPNETNDSVLHSLSVYLFETITICYLITSIIGHCVLLG